MTGTLEYTENAMEILSRDDQGTPVLLVENDPVADEIHTEVKAEPEKIKEFLTELEHLLATSDTGANKLILRTPYWLVQYFGDETKRLADEIESFDYPAARRRLQEMIEIFDKQGMTE